MGLRDGTGVLVADDPDAIADRIVTLYESAEIWRGLPLNGFDLFQREFSEAAGARQVLAVFDGLKGSARN
jgi:glycosyltransferase involved in cell wall biosynthesis